MRTLLHILRGIVREITDQSAYERYLSSHGCAHSAESWRAFCDHHWEHKSRRGRCC